MEGVKARSYVGVLSIRNCTLQILPKLYKYGEKDLDERIRDATNNLLFMLSFTKNSKQEKPDSLSSGLRNQPL